MMQQCFRSLHIGYKVVCYCSSKTLGSARKGGPKPLSLLNKLLLSMCLGVKTKKYSPKNHRYFNRSNKV